MTKHGRKIGTYNKKIDWDVVSYCREKNMSWEETAFKLEENGGEKISAKQLRKRWIDRYRYNLDDEE
jgi:hypothetical protein